MMQPDISNISNSAMIESRFQHILNSDFCNCELRTCTERSRSIANCELYLTNAPNPRHAEIPGSSRKLGDVSDKPQSV
ncbi:hypothetical protein H6G97_41435 [Nostoc flagelliforme FACHB-838]|uniref:Uncharacterized protein n=2 Tax=Nostoc flagelliforme TaxID=1306274 RepID=A0ABR8E4J4_9NOSO|nr:hypothetical protein [Nostoc flagelliforme FACHB-838]